MTSMYENQLVLIA